MKQKIRGAWSLPTLFDAVRTAAVMNRFDAHNEELPVRRLLHVLSILYGAKDHRVLAGRDFKVPTMPSRASQGI